MNSPLAAVERHRPGVTTKSWLLLLLCSALTTVPLASAECECGYTLNYDAGKPVFFTDLLESNFEKMTAIGLRKNTDWRPQEYNASARNSRGPLGQMTDPRNVELVPSSDFEPRKPALKLGVDHLVVNGMVSGAEIVSARGDIMQGTFSASLKVSDVPGTCQAFFWYFNNTQEIDMEFLSKEFDNSNRSWPVNIVLHTRVTMRTGYNPNHWKVLLPYNPAEDYHVYRIDYLENRVEFYMDDIPLLQQLRNPRIAVPTAPGHLVLSHWSNGDDNWSGGPPLKDADMLVRWVKAYFNSSNPERHSDWHDRCGEFTHEKLCVIPSADLTRSKETGRGQDWFYTEHEGFANNQTYFGNAAPRQQQGWSTLQMIIMVVAWIWVIG
ncbi:putative glycoside hydrolase family 16 protein [Podospora aff. communis PSN243]|uniref:Glycoside hydrolase family 16 protein n=1 Tax=Podospora aff. communis PSN243 TaxID=3040156 RepID=A0AAV9GKR0_9PEZI|nr:putative glycoside hydrolase family 16 protein [Podospora aff. communis PSN243]